MLIYSPWNTFDVWLLYSVCVCVCIYIYKLLVKSSVIKHAEIANDALVYHINSKKTDQDKLQEIRLT